MGKRILVWVLAVLGVLVALPLGITVAGLFVPREHSVTRSLWISQPPEAVWDVLTDYAAQTSWRADLKSIERQPNRNGHEVWKLTDLYGVSGTMEVVEAVPPQRLVQHYTDEQGNPMGPWRWELHIAPEKGGSRVIISQRGAYPNPFFRAVVRFFIGYEKFAEDFLTQLGAKFEGSALVEKVW